MSDDEKVVHMELKRKLTALEKLGLGLSSGAGAATIFGVYAVVKAQFWTREEGDAVQKALKEVKTTIELNNAEQTRVVERKVDKILEFMKEEKVQARRDIDRIDRRLENVELIVMSKPKGGK